MIASSSFSSIWPWDQPLAPRGGVEQPPGIHHEVLEQDGQRDVRTHRIDPREVPLEVIGFGHERDGGGAGPFVALGRGDRVGIRMPSGSYSLYMAILSTLAAGAAYVPVDADDPAERAELVFGALSGTTVTLAKVMVMCLAATSAVCCAAPL